MRSAVTASRRRLSQEFKDELCLEVISTSKTIKEVALAYGVGPETLRNWLIKYRETQSACVAVFSNTASGAPASRNRQKISSQTPALLMKTCVVVASTPPR